MMKRPDSSMVGVPKYERVENDFYPTEAACTLALIKYLKTNKMLSPSSVIAEPACGNGAISRVFEAEGHKVFSSDLFPQIEDAEVKDFLTSDFSQYPEDTKYITNPPYAQPYVNLFIERMIELAHTRSTVCALLMRNELDCAKSRRPYFEDCNDYYGKLILTWRPRWIPGSTGSPRHNYAWYIWKGAPENNRQRPLISYGFK